MYSKCKSRPKGRLLLYSIYMTLTWSQRRRLAVIGTAASVLILLVTGIIFAVMYDVPSCMDGKRNQDEAGVDCGGSCAYLCKADVQAPRVSFARSLAVGSGRTDVVAYIENRNQNAESKNAAYTVELVDDQGRIVASRRGMIDLAARSVVPLYVPALAQGVYAGSRALLTFEDSLAWRNVREGSVQPAVRSVEIIPGDRPRVRAVLENPSPQSLYNRTVIATVFSSDGSAIAASQTVVREIQPQDTFDALFTWNEPFPEGALRAEVRAVPVLP